MDSPDTGGPIRGGAKYPSSSSAREAVVSRGTDFFNRIGHKRRTDLALATSGLLLIVDVATYQGESLGVLRVD